MSSEIFFEGISVAFIESLPSGTRVLDYGCGMGVISRFLVKHGFYVVAVDIDQTMEVSLRSGLDQEENSRLFFRVIDNNSCMATDFGSFGCIICREVLEHVPDPSAVVRFFSDHLVVGGSLVLSVPTFWSERFFSLLDPNWLRQSEHVNVFRKNDILKLFSLNRLHCFNVMGQSFCWTLLWMTLAPFRVRHRMGNPKSHEGLVNVALRISKFICTLPGVRWVGDRLLPKSQFFYALKRKPRVLIVYDYLDWILGRWAENIRLLHGFDFDIVTMSLFHARKDKKYTSKLIEKVDIVHLLLPHAYDFFDELNCGCATITTIHHWVEWNDEYQRAAFGSDRIMTGAQDWKRRLVEKGVNPEFITVVHSGVSDAFFQNQQPLLPKTTKLTCGFFAKMDSNESDRKGSRHFLHLVELMKNSRVSEKFRLVISGPGWEEHVAAIKRSGIEIVYFKYIEDKDMPSLYRSIDVYLMLSDIEGGPVTIAEAMASGCLVFSTSVGVAMEIVSDNVTGRVVTTSNLDDLLNKLLKYQTNPEEALIITKRARQFAQTNMRFNQTMLPIGDLYSKVLELNKKLGKGDFDTAKENQRTLACAAKVSAISAVSR